MIASLIVLALCGAAFLPAGAGAATITVDTTLDEFDTSGTGSGCALREAVQAANTNAPFGGCATGQPTADTLNLAATTYTLSGAANDDTNASGDLDVTGGGDLEINGTATIGEVPTTLIESDGDSPDRIIDIRPNGSAQGFHAQFVSLQNGAVAGGASGGAIRIGDPDAHFSISSSRVQGNDAGGSGGAIFFPAAVDGYVFDVSEVQFSQNNADEEGGAIWIDVPQDNNATVDKSAFLENTAGEMGGAAYIESAGATNDESVLQFSNSTLTGNTADAGGGAVAFDFGLAGTVWFKFSTIANNSTPKLGAGGGVFTNSADQFVLFQGGTIISGNSAGGVLSNCAGPGTFDSLTGSYNLDSGSSCFGSTPSVNDLVNTNPLLGMSRINSAASAKDTTETMALFAGSPAIDRIPIGSPCSGAGAFDQRLVTRPVNGGCDVGAFEGTNSGPVDADGDTVNDPVDNCPLDQNPSQANSDGDLQGDTCDPDDDNDVVLDEADNCPIQAGLPSNAGCPAPPVTTPASPAATPPAVCKKKKKKKHHAATAKCKKKKKKHK